MPPILNAVMLMLLVSCGDNSTAEDIDADGFPADEDCDDSLAQVNPGAEERCDGLDNDCDGVTDEGVLQDWYRDADGDTHGVAGEPHASCEPPPGYVAGATDCDDLNPAAFPDNPEVCDEADNNCDGSIDEGVTTTYYLDADDDSYGLPEKTTEACSHPTGYAAKVGDCDDSDDTISPSATEICDGIDNDCDGSIDEDDAADAAVWYADDDGDGYGGRSGKITRACDQPAGYAASSDDCDDTDATASPDQDERCDGIDNDCDGSIDEDDATDASTWYADNDGDGYGGRSRTVACDQPVGFSDNNSDCDDGDNNANPGESEVCDSIDNDCDGDTDEDVTTTYYLDYDGDGYGDIARTTEACAVPRGYTRDSTDCDDTNNAANPGEAEVCDEADNDCDGDTDEGVTTDFYVDSDDDGFGDAGSTLVACSAPEGYVPDDTDCDDGDDTVYPGAEEVCDEVDNDCDGSLEESCFCSDGIDNDGDSLIDCEDGDCDAQCTESDCSNDDDDDGDGLTDCRDDDCIGTADCQLSSVVEGGQFQRRQTGRHVKSVSYGGLTSSRSWVGSSIVSVTDLSGYVMTQDSTSPIQCGWTLDHVAWNRYRRTHDGDEMNDTYSALSHSGFSLSSGCPLLISTGMVVPQYLNINGQILHTERYSPVWASDRYHERCDGDPRWLQMSATTSSTSTHSSTSTRGSTCCPVTRYRTTSQRYAAGSIVGQDAYVSSMCAGDGW